MASPEQHKAWTDKWVSLLLQKSFATPPTMCVMSTIDRAVLGLCKVEIPDDRYKRGAMFCSPECHADYRRLRRFWRSLQNCRLCGRKARTPKKNKAQAEAVRSEHEVVMEVFGH